MAMLCASVHLAQSLRESRAWMVQLCTGLSAKVKPARLKVCDSPDTGADRRSNPVYPEDTEIMSRLGALQNDPCIVSGIARTLSNMVSALNNSR